MRWLMIGLLASLAAMLLAVAGGLSALAQVSVPSTFKHITIDGTFAQQSRSRSDSGRASEAYA